jgi:hypothetical protein
MSEVRTVADALEFEAAYVLGREVELLDSWEPQGPDHVLVIFYECDGLAGGKRRYVAVYVDGRRATSTLISSDIPEWPGAPSALLA